MNYVSGIVGVGILSMPYVFMECGLALGVALIVLCGWSCSRGAR